MPGWLQTFADINPVSHVIAAIRDLANNGEVTPRSAGRCSACRVVVAIFAPLAVRSYSRKM